MSPEHRFDRFHGAKNHYSDPPVIFPSGIFPMPASGTTKDDRVRQLSHPITFAENARFRIGVQCATLMFMFGYIFAAIIGLVLIGFALSAVGGGGQAAKRKKGDLRDGKPIQPEAPAADEPTPDRSAAASRHEVESAKQHIPPA
jgi:hypothetical protein